MTVDCKSLLQFQEALVGLEPAWRLSQKQGQAANHGQKDIAHGLCIPPRLGEVDTCLLRVSSTPFPTGLPFSAILQSQRLGLIEWKKGSLFVSAKPK